MKSDYSPVIFNTPKENGFIEIYFAHDIHYGSAEHDYNRWKKFKKNILEKPNRYVILIGDAMENAIPGSKSDMFSQVVSPQEQKEWVYNQFVELKERIIAVTDGNHEQNRSFKVSGLYPLYDCCIMAGIEERFRPNFVFIDIGVGNTTKNKCGQVRYVGYCSHKATDLKNYCSADYLDGVDFMAYGHDHDPKMHPRAKLVYDSKNKSVTKKTVEVINSGSFLKYGGYAAKAGYRPNSDVIFKIILDGKQKSICTCGFHLI